MSAMPGAGAVRRYHPALVVLHWLVAALVLLGLAMGTFRLSALPNAAPDKIGALQGHMIAGGLVLLLMLARLVVRRVTVHPPPATTGFGMADRLAPLAHGLVAKLLMVLIALHVAAATYHQWVRRDGLLSRMGIGSSRRRSAGR